MIAGWVAPIATMIAAIMTAANLGARVTGWGFVIFTAGSIAWSIVGLATDQTNLVATNGFLTLVNLVGIWRWLGRQGGYEDGGKSAAQASRRSPGPNLFTASGIAGKLVVDRHLKVLGKAVEALIECPSGNIAYVVIATSGPGGLGEHLRGVAQIDIDFAHDRLVLSMDENTFAALPEIPAGNWPASAPRERGATR
jgi:hypothetical protein